MEAATIWGLLNLVLSTVLLIAGVGAFYYINILVHELGHLLAALLVGWKPLALCIGHGKRRTVFSIRDVEFQIGATLAGGRMYACPRRLKGFRTAQFFFALGGPVASAGVAFVVYLIAISTVTSPTYVPLPLCLWMFFTAACVELAANLWPRMLVFSDCQLPSDGLAMWRALWLRKAEISHLYLASVINLSSQLLRKGRVREAREEFEYGAAASEITRESEFCGRTLWICLLWDTDHDEEARAECAQLLNEHPEESEKRVEVLDVLACIPVYFGQRKMIPDALEFIEKALAAAPEKITLNGTKGSLLIEKGDLDAGIQLIEEVRAVSESETDHAICTWYLALAFQKGGNVKKAHEMLSLAKSRYPDCVVAPRIEKEIWASPLERVEPALTSP